MCSEWWPLRTGLSHVFVCPQSSILWGPFRCLLQCRPFVGSQEAYITQENHVVPIYWTILFWPCLDFKGMHGDFRGGPVVKNPPCRGHGLISGPGRSHMPWSHRARVPQLLSLCSRARSHDYWSPHTSNLRSATRKPQQWEARTPQGRVVLRGCLCGATESEHNKKLIMIKIKVCVGKVCREAWEKSQRGSNFPVSLDLYVVSLFGCCAMGYAVSCFLFQRWKEIWNTCCSADGQKTWCYLSAHSDTVMVNEVGCHIYHRLWILCLTFLIFCIVIRKEEKGTTEDEMAGWHHRLNGHECE